MPTNLDRYQADLEALIVRGDDLHHAIQRECHQKEFDAEVKKKLGDKAEEFLKGIPQFNRAYQPWYSEAKALIKQLLPDRLDDFVRHYEKPKTRKEISYANYTIEDALQGLRVTRGYDKEVVVDSQAAINHVHQQIEILKSAQGRFKSSLFDIRQLVMADLMDSELGAAAELAKKKFLRAAGAVAGVVLEKHLHQVCDNHGVKITKKDAGISHLNDQLKNADVIDVPRWRAIQYLGDLRNLCDHPKGKEPTHEQMAELIAGVTKVTKTLF